MAKNRILITKVPYKITKGILFSSNHYKSLRTICKQMQNEIKLLSRFQKLIIPQLSTSHYTVFFWYIILNSDSISCLWFFGYPGDTDRPIS